MAGLHLWLKPLVVTFKRRIVAGKQVNVFNPAAFLDNTSGRYIIHVHHHPGRESGKAEPAIWLTQQYARYSQVTAAYFKSVSDLNIQQPKQSGVDPDFARCRPVLHLYPGAFGTPLDFELAAQRVLIADRFYGYKLESIAAKHHSGKLHHATGFKPALHSFGNPRLGHGATVFCFQLPICGQERTGRRYQGAL